MDEVKTFHRMLAASAWRGLVFYRRPTGALKYPDLVTILNGRKHLYKWNGNAYSD